MDLVLTFIFSSLIAIFSPELVQLDEKKKKDITKLIISIGVLWVCLLYRAEIQVFIKTYPSPSFWIGVASIAATSFLLGIKLTKK